MASINDTLISFYDYLESGADSTLKTRMQYYKKKRAQFKQDFHTITINDPSVQDDIQRILTRITIPESKKGRFHNASLTVYEFLKEIRELKKAKNPKINFFLKLIDQYDQATNRLLNILMVIGIVSVGILPNFLIFGGFTMLQRSLALTFFIPLVSIVFTLGVASYSLYQRMIKKTHQPVYKQFIDNFFLLAQTALKIIAYGVLLAAATTMTPVAAILLVVASAVDVFKSLVDLGHVLVKEKKQGPIHVSDTLIIKQQKTRDANFYAKTRNALIIEVGNTVLMAGIVAVWSFVPGGFLVSVLAVSAIALVFLMAKLASSYNDKRMDRKLTEAFEQVEEAHGVQERLIPQNDTRSTNDIDKSQDELPRPAVEKAAVIDHHHESTPAAGFFSSHKQNDSTEQGIELEDLVSSHSRKPIK